MAYGVKFFSKVNSVCLPCWTFTNAMDCGFWNIEAAKWAVGRRVSLRMLGFHVGVFKCEGSGGKSVIV